MARRKALPFMMSGWGVTYDGDVFVLKDARIAAYFPKTGFKGQSPKHVFCDINGVVYLATSGNTVMRVEDSSDAAFLSENLPCIWIMKGN